VANVLITGGAGFIGTRLGRRLVEAGHQLSIIDSLHPQVHNGSGWPTELHPNVTRYIGDVSHRPDLDAVLSVCRPDVIVHLAAETGTGQSLREASRHGSVNVVGTTNLLDAMTAADVRPDHVLLASSRAVYGEGPWKDQTGEAFVPSGRLAADLEAARWDPRSPGGGSCVYVPAAAERVPAAPTNVYAATKLAQEHLLQAWCTSFAVPLSVLRLQNVYGPGQSLTNSYTGVVSLFSRLASEGVSIPVYEDGNIVRDFVFVDDVVTAFERSIEQVPSGPRLLDIGSGEPGTLLDAASLVASLAGAPTPHITGQYRLGDVRAASCDITAAQRELGYEPAFSLKQGLGRLLDWVTATLK
jgi:dTDP-L-rhamnose 4-epimerase